MGLYLMPDSPNTADIVERLQTRLPVCPFSTLAPKHDLEASDPCPVCNDYGDERSKNLCHGADTRILDEVAAIITELRDARDKQTALARSRLKIINVVKDENEQLRAALKDHRKAQAHD